MKSKNDEVIDEVFEVIVIMRKIEIENNINVPEKLSIFYVIGSCM
jgi:hypothetical protein